MGDVEIAGIKIPENGTSGISGTKVLSLALTRTTIHNLRKILHPLKLNLNLLLIGDAGIGKNTYINYINQIRRHPAIRYSFNEDTVPEDLIGSYRMHPDGVIRWEDGLLLQAMKTGSVFVADEMNLAQPETLKRFSSVFSENKITLYEGDGSEVRAENGFCFIATQNPQEGFEGRKHLPREIQKSFASVFLDSYPQEELLEILCSIYPSVPQKAFSCAVSVNQKVENSIRAGKLGIDDLESYHFNLRTLKRLGRRLELYQRELFQELIDLYILPFRSDEDRKFIFEIFTEEFSARADFEDELIQLNHFKETHFLPEILNQFSEKDEFSVSQPEIFTGETGMNLKIGSMLLPLNSTTDDFTKANFQELCRNFPPAGARKRALEASAAAIGAGENLLLECGDNVEAEEIIYFLCGILNKKIESIEFSGSMMTSDLIGSAKPEGEQIIWKDGPLTRAVKNGNQILFKNLETAGPEILEKLNMLTDDARALVLPAESGETKPVHLKNTAGIFAVKYFRKRRSEKTISRAFRNRFTAILIPPVIDAQGLIRTASFYFGFDHTPDFLDVFASFHLWIHTAASEKRIGSSHIHPYQFGLTNLKRWCFYISSCLAEKPQLDSSLSENQFREILIRGCEVSYINEIENEEERLQAKETLDQILSGTSGISEFISSLAGRSKYPESAAESKKKSRDTNSEAKSGGRSSSGRNLPGSSGESGNGARTGTGRGKGAPGRGGGGTGIRTEDLYREFLMKRRELWNYSLEVSLEEFDEFFGAEIEKNRRIFSRLLNPPAVNRKRFMSSGSRIDARRYLACISGSADSRIFERKIPEKNETPFQNTEVMIAVNKGRRMFNFDYSPPLLVAVMCLADILNEHKIPFAVTGYSRQNGGGPVRIARMKQFSDPYHSSARNAVFEGLSREWNSDTVSEHTVIPEIHSFFSPNCRNPLMILISDFRGMRSKMNPEKEIAHQDALNLKQVLSELRGTTEFIGAGIGKRNLAGEFFRNSIQSAEDNIFHFPEMLASMTAEILLKNLR